MGIGLSASPLGLTAVAFGVAAGVAFMAIFGLRSATARLRGWDAVGQPTAAGFDLEDILYVIAPLTWLGWLGPFVVAAGIGAPVFSLWCARNHIEARRQVRQMRRAATSASATRPVSAPVRPVPDDELVAARRV
jgi:hypothetical protein